MMHMKSTIAKGALIAVIPAAAFMAHRAHENNKTLNNMLHGSDSEKANKVKAVMAREGHHSTLGRLIGNAVLTPAIPGTGVLGAIESHMYNNKLKAAFDPKNG